ncbi:MAG: dihydropteroate synthase [Flavobacteriales bacterium]|nr:dihydropteroate synthase [Flavobacteriales bacterium]|tara:strand:- start:3052 stop:3882 length:831 start_codon:yes stop_codon:yes gene_type:complete
MTINIGGNIMNFKKPKIMGILNVTPDSFYDGGVFNSEKKVLNQVNTMIDEGVDIIDIGGYSSKPGAENISLDTELKRVIPYIEIIKKNFEDIPVSIDTFRSKVAKEAVNHGAEIINDISSGDLDKTMFETVSELKVPYIMMHMKGKPIDMQINPVYKNLVVDISENLSKKIFEARTKGINDIIIDPGFGFGKTVNDNYILLKNLSFFKELGCPILVGISRKSMIYKVLNTDPQNSLNGTTCLNTISLMNGANILRVHDVKQAKEVVDLYESLNSRL